MANQSWDPDGGARRALQAIVDDPQYGTAALSRPMVMTSLLKDLLPDAPREAGLLIAAAEANLAGTLRGSKEQGVDAGTACRLASAHLEQSSAFTSDACEWVTGELAMALGYQPAGGAQPGAPQATQWAAVTDDQPPGAAQPGPPQGTQWAAATDNPLAPTAEPGWHPQYQQNAQYPASPPYSQLPPTGSYQAQAPLPNDAVSPQHDRSPQFPPPQYASPQYASPQYAAPQYPAPQYGYPQNPSPQFPSPQYRSPGPGQVAGALAPPPSIRSAVRLMYIGAALAVLQAIVGIVPLAGAAMLGQPVPSASDVSYVRGQLISYVVVALISIALWLWLAWASKRGRSWSRIVSAVVFALATGVLVVSLIAPANHAGRIIFLASWVVGLLAVISQWQRSSSEYYRTRSRPVSQ